MTPTLTIGAHEEGLARAQADRVVELLRRTKPDYPIHLEVISLPDDRASGVHDDHIAETQGAIKTLHQLLRDSDVDVVIHRGFDLRAHVPDDLQVAAVLPRNSPYEALLSSSGESLDELDPGASVGVTQIRSRVQLMEHRDDLVYELVPGDMGHWLLSMLEGQVDAFVLPNGACENLGLQQRVCEIFPPDMLVPAPGSGVQVCVVRRGDAQSLERLARLHDTRTGTEYASEAALMEALGGSWEFPIGALAQQLDAQLRLIALVATPDGARVLRQGVEGQANDPGMVGETLADLLLGQGAADILDAEIDADASAPVPVVGATPRHWEDEEIVDALEDIWDEES